MYEPKFEVRFRHSEATGTTMEINDPLAMLSTFSMGGVLELTFRDNAEVDKFMEAVEQEQAARYGDAHPSCPICGGPLPCQSCLTALRMDQ